MFVKNQTWQVPTLIRVRTQVYGDDAVYRKDVNLKYLNNKSQALWEKLGQEFEKKMPARTKGILRKFYAKQLAVTGMIKKAGVKIMAGSDLGGIWILPGFGLHGEFQELAKAGLTPLEVLQATTLNGAEFLGREAKMGTVEEGKDADLVLLDANPLVDVANLGRIFSVVLNGKYFSKSALQSMKDASVSRFNGNWVVNAQDK